VAVLAPFNEAFSIDDPYTGKWYPSVKIELPGPETKVLMYYSTFPTLRIINHHRRLLAMFFMPYNTMLQDMIVHAQAEFYICQDNALNVKLIALPLRVEKDTMIKDPPIIRLESFDFPTFAFESHVAYNMSLIFADNSVVEHQSPKEPEGIVHINPITYYVPDDRHLSGVRLVHAFQFLIREEKEDAEN
jgi:hypothetical protein